MSDREWSPADLDRCEHGRHSIDPCWGCADGQSTGNLFLARPDRQGGQWIAGQPVRIGTMLGGQPILVVPIRERESSG